jgi:Ca2+-binding EF-hand superfamily protein
VEPLVPGFDAVSTPKLPPGFGAEAELFTVEVTPQDREEAARSFGRYDDNHDGKIDAEEMRRSRYGNDLPIYDRNHDGVLTLSEMEYRYARRRVENTRDAATASRSEGDRDRDRDRRRDGRSPERRGEDEASASSDDKKDDRKSYRRKPPIERLPVGIPDWFARDDADGDGQIAMAEYSTSWTDTVMADFNQFDLNRDGLVTPSEAVKATSNGAVRGGSIGGNSASAPAAPTAPAAATELSSTPATTSSSAPAAPSASKPAEPIKIEPKYYEYFKKLVVKYDKNSDGVLTPDEWSSMSKSPEAADADGDKRITVEEYTRWSVQR